MRQEFVIAGYIPSQARGRGLRSLVVGYNKDGALVAAGHVGTGFTSQSDAELMRRLAPLATKGSPYHGAAARERGVVWVKPEMVAEIEFRSWTHGGNLRHASFQGLREDKPAGEVVAEIPEAGETSEEAPAKAAPGAARKGTASVTLTRPDKLLWPKAGLTKAGLLEHYERVWPRMAHYVVDRPLSLVRMPDGVDGKQRFFQKHASAGMPDVIRTMKDPQDGEELLFISDIDGMAALVQLGVVELHIWGATTAEPGKPDQVVFDLDPDEGLGADDVRKAAIEVRERLAEVGFASLVKTSGGKGFHIVVPLQPAEDWATVKTFAHDFAQAMAQSAPERYTATLSKKARHGRIFIDYLRNGRGATTVAPYSTRAKPDATISMPISWKQLEDGAGPADFTADAKAVARAMKAADPWADYEKLRRPLRG